MFAFFLFLSVSPCANVSLVYQLERRLFSLSGDEPLSISKNYSLISDSFPLRFSIWNHLKQSWMPYITIHTFVFIFFLFFCFSVRFCIKSRHSIILACTIQSYHCAWIVYFMCFPFSRSHSFVQWNFLSISQ